jgi:hypothetical protein
LLLPLFIRCHAQYTALPVHRRRRARSTCSAAARRCCPPDHHPQPQSTELMRGCGRQQRQRSRRVHKRLNSQGACVVVVSTWDGVSQLRPGCHNQPQGARGARGHARWYTQPERGGVCGNMLDRFVMVAQRVTTHVACSSVLAPAMPHSVGMGAALCAGHPHHAQTHRPIHKHTRLPTTDPLLSQLWGTTPSTKPRPSTPARQVTTHT